MYCYLLNFSLPLSYYTLLCALSLSLSLSLSFLPLFFLPLSFTCSPSSRLSFGPSYGDLYYEPPDGYKPLSHFIDDGKGNNNVIITRVHALFNVIQVSLDYKVM